MNLSINNRMIIGASLVLVVFAVLTAFALNKAFEESSRTATEERLRGQLYFLIGETEVDEQGNIELPNSSTLARLNQPNSGLYASVYSQSKLIWSSRSAMGAGFPFVKQLSAGEEYFNHQQYNEPSAFVLAYGVAWQVGESTIPISDSLVEESNNVTKQIKG